MTQWNPAEKPFRLVETYQTSASGCYGWATRPTMYATEAEVLAAVAAPMKAGVMTHTADKARLSAEGKLIGWQHLGFRKRKLRR